METWLCFGNLTIPDPARVAAAAAARQARDEARAAAPPLGAILLTSFVPAVEEHTGPGTVVLAWMTTWRELADRYGIPAVDIASRIFQAFCDWELGDRGVARSHASSLLAMDLYGAFWTDEADHDTADRLAQWMPARVTCPLFGGGPELAGRVDDALVVDARWVTVLLTAGEPGATRRCRMNAELRTLWRAENVERLAALVTHHLPGVAPDVGTNVTDEIDALASAAGSVNTYEARDAFRVQIQAILRRFGLPPTGDLFEAFYDHVTSARRVPEWPRLPDGPDLRRSARPPG